LRTQLPDAVKRIIDANINRSKEGLRVCEEVTRFILEDASLTAALKKVRHEINSLAGSLAGARALQEARDARRDTGRYLYGKELIRRDHGDIFSANMQRAKESIRVLEEFSKLSRRRTAVRFKELRYTLYEIEKKVLKKL